MPTSQEQELLELVRLQRQGAVPAVASQLPDLDPMMLLSLAARREVEAAGGIRQAPLQPQEIRITPGQYSAGIEIQGQDLETMTNQAMEASASLEALFMERAIRETGAQLSGPVASDFDFEFSAGDDITLTDSASTPYRAPSSGEVVSRRGNRGFEVLPRSRAEIYQEAQRVVETQTRQQVARQVVESTTRPEPQAPTKSRYEVLMGPSVFDE